MFNCYFRPVRVEVQYTPTFIPISEIVEISGGDMVVKPSTTVRLVEPLIRCRAATPMVRAQSGNISPSAIDYLQPSFEESARVAQILEQLDDKFSYAAWLEKQKQPEQTSIPSSSPIPETSQE